MTTADIQRLLEEKSTFMRDQCLPYQLDKAMIDALRSVLNGQPLPFRELFRAYNKSALDQHFRNCLATYQHTLQLAQASSTGIFPLPKGGETPQESLLASASDSGKSRQAKKALWAVASSTQKEVFDLYDTVRIDIMDLEQMFCSFFGCQAGAPDPKYEVWVRRTILPDDQLGLSWWSALP